LALLAHRNTPSSGLDSSPVQRFMSRRTRSLIPIIDSLLEPALTNETENLALRKET